MRGGKVTRPFLRSDVLPGGRGRLLQSRRNSCTAVCDIRGQCFCLSACLIVRSLSSMHRPQPFRLRILCPCSAFVKCVRYAIDCQPNYRIWLYRWYRYMAAIEDNEIIEYTLTQNLTREHIVLSDQRSSTQAILTKFITRTPQHLEESGSSGIDGIYYLLLDVLVFLPKILSACLFFFVPRLYSVRARAVTTSLDSKSSPSIV